MGSIYLIFGIPGLLLLLLAGRLMWSGLKKPKEEKTKLAKTVDIVLTVLVAAVLAVLGGFMIMMVFAITYM